MKSPPSHPPGRKHPRRIVLMGYIVRGPIGGMAWHHLNYALGLARLGHQVMFLEDSDDYPSCYDPSRFVLDTEPTFGLKFAAQTFQRLGLPDHWSYFDAHRNRWHGPMADRAVEFCRSADLLLNVSGVNPWREWSVKVPIRVLIDTDPVFTQVRHLNDTRKFEQAKQHNRFLTFGENIPAGLARVPDDGLPWQPTRQPVALEAWPFTPPPEAGPLTTVMQWDSYKVEEHRGQRYGMKSQSIEDYLDLPRTSGARLTLALGGEQAPRQKLIEHGWALDDPMAVCRDPWTYQDYIRQSCAEWSIAKHGYVIGRSGWFSERSACYLALGRPVLLQDTGFSNVLPTGKGLLAFNTPDEAAEAIRQLQLDYPLHCREARRIAETHFASQHVLGELLTAIESPTADQMTEKGRP
ncbi:MAG: hypothetical protein IT445_02920 [Phycisphaeraceae bacterium]|nr:hypothetical protein [Phycisphaeraceae bacterium]